jgi:hypothetical protein
VNKHYELIRWFNWPTDQCITELGRVSEHLCEVYIAERRRGDGKSPSDRRSTVNMAVQVINGLVQYHALFSADRLPAEFRPFGGKAAAAVAGLMHRLLTGTARRTDRRLIKQNLWEEAEVNRATMNRAHIIFAEWDDHVAQHSTADPEAARRDDEIRELRLKLAAKKRECTDPRRRLDAATTVIAALHHDNTLLKQELAHHRADVLPIRIAAEQ